jgi:transposase
VAIGEDCAEEPVRKFGPFTSDLHRMADWLSEHHVETVVMESTGVYWIAVFQILEQRGFEVKLVNAAHAKNLPGRKSDVSDCQWLQQLHTFGLLNGSFRPKDEVCVLRSFLRLRDTLVKDCSSHVLRMQKALTEMNVQVHRVLSDIAGYSGMAIIRAILARERDPLKLAQMKHPRVKASTERIVRALEGNTEPSISSGCKPPSISMMPINSKSCSVKPRWKNTSSSSKPNWISRKSWP